jgi:hypothetical protein
VSLVDIVEVPMCGLLELFYLWIQYEKSWTFVLISRNLVIFYQVHGRKLLCIFINIVSTTWNGKALNDFSAPFSLWCMSSMF